MQMLEDVYDQFISEDKRIHGLSLLPFIAEAWLSVAFEEIVKKEVPDLYFELISHSGDSSRRFILKKLAAKKLKVSEFLDLESAMKLIQAVNQGVFGGKTSLQELVNRFGDKVTSIIYQLLVGDVNLSHEVIEFLAARGVYWKTTKELDDLVLSEGPWVLARSAVKAIRSKLDESNNSDLLRQAAYILDHVEMQSASLDRIKSDLWALIRRA